ncbi:MAG: ArsR family transcriptional regulator [Desulfobulbaceae bacterium]|nr:MAG: ArsR family transcriptional regulator [Desulfobulbaceae bacterium]
MKTISEQFKALGDETRLRIMALLLDGTEYCVCDLMAALDMPQSTVSRHLAYLKHSGWLRDRRQNRWIYYQLRADQASALQRDILVALAATLPEIDTARRDRKQMDSHLAHKAADACDSSA